MKDLGTVRGARRFKCKCECGRIVSKRAYDVIKGHTKSCGCLAKELASERLKEASKNRIRIKVDPIKVLYKRYQSGASRRDLEFSLTFEQFARIVKKNCAYCGIMPKAGLTGVDRIDSSKGYIMGNCNPACKTCNISKWTLSKTEFLGMVKRIYKHSIKENQ